MKEVTFRIPDDKYPFFLELMHNLGFEQTDNFDVPEEHKSIVRERIQNSNPEKLIPWQEARERLQFKNGQQ